MDSDMCTSIKDMAGFAELCGMLVVVTLRLKVGFLATWVASLYVSERMAGKAGRDGRSEEPLEACCWPDTVESVNSLKAAGLSWSMEASTSMGVLHFWQDKPDGFLSFAILLVTAISPHTAGGRVAVIDDENREQPHARWADGQLG